MLKMRGKAVKGPRKNAEIFACNRVSRYTTVTKGGCLHAEAGRQAGRPGKEANAEVAGKAEQGWLACRLVAGDGDGDGDEQESLLSVHHGYRITNH